MGVLVAAAGTMAGGLAAKAMGADKQAPDGGGIPGVTTSKGSGKSGRQGSVPQVDPTIALNYFSQASSAQGSGYDQGLSYYGTAINQATNEIKQGYANANATLKPLSYSSGQALNQQMRMLGLDPIQATAGFGDALRTGYEAVKSSMPGSGAFVTDIASQMDAASSIRDPAARAAAVANIQNSIKTGSAGLLAGYQSQLAALKAPDAPVQRTATGAPGSGIVGPYNYLEYKGQQYGTQYIDPNALKDPSRANNAIDAYQKDLAAYNAQKSSIQSQIDAANSYSAAVQDLGNSFAQNYGANYDSGYTADQIGSVVENLPGYQFNLQQGLKAINRVGAAKGMLGSANTTLAEQQYGQGIATSYYNQYMGYLSGLTAQGTPATAQISANQSAEGTALATLAQNYGAARMDTERQKADYLASQLMASGNLFNQTAMYNAGLQFQGQQNSQSQAAQMANTALQGAMAGQRQTQQFQGQQALLAAQQNFNVQQGQQLAQGYLGISGSPGFNNGYSASAYMPGQGFYRVN
jgi:hypothetical protein